MEKIVEIKTCKYCGCQFEITDKDLEFYDKVSPVFSGKKYNIPTPTLCPDCRQQRRLSFRNERKLYKRKCDLTGKEILSIYSPNKPYKVYDTKEWWSDKWDALDYGKDFDFNRGFFEQFDELMKEVPFQGLLQESCENSEYVNDGVFNKNCYLCFTSFEVENSLYSNNIFWSKNCIDIFWSTKSENCYESIYLNNCNFLFFSKYCYDSSNCNYISYSIGSQYCSFSIGLINSKYKFLNKQYTKNDYNNLINKLNTDNIFFKECLNKYDKLSKKMFFKNVQGTRYENCLGDFISDSSNSNYVFDVHGVDDSKYIYQGGSLHNCMDISITGSNNKKGYCYEGLSIPGSNFILFSNIVRESNNILYSESCYNCSNLFGCVGLKNKSYCILNKQYTKDEYEELVARIIEHMMKTGEWGEFFPSSMSPFGYNETVAMEYYPITRKNIIGQTLGIKLGQTQGLPLQENECRGEPCVHPKNRFNWSTYESPFPKVEKIIPASKLPNNITDIPDDILNWAIECEITKKPFRIIKQELEFYRKHGLPIPRRHPDQRHLDRMSLRNPRKLFDRKCDKCGKEIKTTYNPERKEIVYCEECYNKEVY